MHRPPTQGIEGSKPRLPKAAPNGAPTTKAQLGALNHEYLRARNEQMRAKAAVAQMELERRRGLLIDKKWARDSLQYIGVCFRQRSLLAPAAIARRLTSLALVEPAKEHAAGQVLLEEIRALLTELGSLELKGTDPNWLRELERKELGLQAERATPPEPPGQAASKEAKAARRRERQTATMRKLRAEGRTA